ncbi:hypothetical protein BJF78_23730 [Pseudonocardia sp. CNS-139]|nr:hypothetical protein BJF78_23730 [Pseudonocardia sp. CNS-139]
MPPLSPVPFPPMTYSHLCDTFVRRNANMSTEDEEARWPAVVEAAAAGGADAGGIGIGAAWGSNFEGPFTSEQRMTTLRRQHDVWDGAGIPVTFVSLADPMSWCMPHWVEEQLALIARTWPAVKTLHLHLHDARGMALASIYAALRALDESFTLHLDVVAGGIGGCPYCGNGRATGMAATEDVVHMLETMGVPTGVDLDKLVDAVWLLEEVIGRATPGHVGKAGPRPSADRLYDPNLPLVETHEQATHFKLGEKVLADGCGRGDRRSPTAGRGRTRERADADCARGSPCPGDRRRGRGPVRHPPARRPGRRRREGRAARGRRRRTRRGAVADPTRTVPAQLLFEYLNWGKRSVGLDIADPARAPTSPGWWRGPTSWCPGWPRRRRGSST